MEKEKGKVFFERLRYPVGSCEYKSTDPCTNRAVWKICLDEIDNEMMRVCAFHAYKMGLKEFLDESL